MSENIKMTTGVHIEGSEDVSFNTVSISGYDRGFDIRSSRRVSGNNVSITSVEAMGIFAAMQKNLDSLDADPAKKEEISHSIQNLRSAYGTHSFKEAYTDFVICLGAHVTAFAPFLSALKSMITGD